jgi:hypothetical protein
MLIQSRWLFAPLILIADDAIFSLASHRRFDIFRLWEIMVISIRHFSVLAREYFSFQTLIVSPYRTLNALNADKKLANFTNSNASVPRRCWLQDPHLNCDLLHDDMMTILISGGRCCFIMLHDIAAATSSFLPLPAAGRLYVPTGYSHTSNFTSPYSPRRAPS